MKNFFKVLIRRVAQGLLFIVFYVLFSCFKGDEIDVLKIVYVSIAYVITLCILGVIAPCLQKFFGFDKK